MTTTAVRVPAGWYADPLSADATGQPTHRRWWDGQGWSHHTALMSETPAELRSAWSASAPESPDVSPASVEALRLSASYTAIARQEAAKVAEQMPLHVGSPVTGTVGAVAPARTVAQAASAERAHEIGVVADLEALWNETPSRQHGQHRAERPTIHTASLWLIATMPITQLLLLHWVRDLAATTATPQYSILLALVLPFVLYGALASQDARQLSAAGHLTTPPWIVAVIMPAVYLGARGLHLQRTVGANPWPALLVWGLLQGIVLTVAAVIDPLWVQGVLALIGL
ncbi:uncharacterized protein DUF2510 [Microcella putealis]|uniref:Uncharacterized protein DUF2510 n=1 Tax=Microcella putealis TaxID=337005 RepID=A0A4Q7LXW7_9MICO|nr:DUF2510 domain-containing protein [Microcella putealis]RZS59078.1 uncharacterized protein DUF2510 [Microcella putealis]TQM24104.1 uncharacterized protein DUF2510 [Microcella putealis]